VVIVLAVQEVAVMVLALPMTLASVNVDGKEIIVTNHLKEELHHANSTPVLESPKPTTLLSVVGPEIVLEKIIAIVMKVMI
jgi:hypothetical protein